MKKVSRSKLAHEFVELLDKHPVKPLVKALARQVAEQKLANQIDLLVMDIEHELLQQRGLLNVGVTSAHHLTAVVKAELTHYFKDAASAKSVQLAEHLDLDLLGGLVARTAGMELDLSIKKQLERLKI